MKIRVSELADHCSKHPPKHIGEMLYIPRKLLGESNG